MKPVNQHLHNTTAAQFSASRVSDAVDSTSADVEQYLHNFYEHKVAAAQLVDASYGRLWRTMATLAFAGGKRLRPRLVLTAYRMYGGVDDRAVLPVAVAQELLHLALLIHDDIADKDNVRYGTDNVSGQYVKIYQSMIDGDEGQATAERSIHHNAQSAALLAGDLLLASAQAMVLESSFGELKKLAVHHVVSESIFQVAAGQLLDMEASMSSMSQTDTSKVANLKTASYSFIAPLQCGAILAGAPAAEAKKLERLGSLLGQAFQLADDILGVFGDQAVTGKSNMTDLKEGKHTYLMQLVYELAPETDMRYLTRHFGRGRLTHAQATRIRRIITDCGARQRVETQLDRYQSDIMTEVQSLSVAKAAKDELQTLIQASIRRDR